MKLKEFVNITRNRANNQVSFNLKAKQLAKIGITPKYLLNLKVPNDLSLKSTNSIIIKKEVKKEKIWKK